MPSSPLPQSVRGEHERTLHGLVGRLEKRLAEIESRLRDACEQRAEMRPVFQETWKPRFETLKKTVYHLRRLVSARQSLFVMGKRGQGKTTLLRSWVGRGITAPVGREPLPLPTGMEETTCSLVRLTASATNADYLQVDLLPADSLPGVEPRPDHPQLNCLKLSRTVSKGIDPESPFFVVRYPVKNKDEKLRCASDGPHYYNLSETGEIALTSLQYYASEVTVPLQLAGLRGHARLLLDALDVVDAPGADPAAKGEYAEWVRHKNRAVIHQGMDRLDLLLLVCSAQTAAINLNAQVQDDVLKPWVERCKQHPQGRLLLAVTHAGELLDEAKQVVKNGHHGGGVTNSVARKLVGNILEPLAAVRVGDISLFKMGGEVRDWPPMFFVEEQADRLKEYREGWGNINGTASAEKLSSRLGKPPKQRLDGLCLGESCVMQLVNDWGEQFPNWPAEQLRRVQGWLIQSFCSLLDPNDAGLGLLTDFVRNWAESGPMAQNHAQERHDATVTLQRQYEQLRGELNQPDHKTTVDELHKVRTELEGWWKDHPAGPLLQLSESCRARLLQAEKNRGPKLDERREFRFEDVVEDLIQDTLRQLFPQEKGSKPTASTKTPSAPRPGLEPPIARALRECLNADYPLLQLAAKYQGRFSNDRENLARLQAVGLERIVRIIDFLAKADDEELKAVARYCYGKHIEQSELLRPLYREVIEPGYGEDKEAFDEAFAQGEALLTAIRKAGCRQAYE